MGTHIIPYTDAEAVAAMGVKADDNPLHHDRAIPLYSSMGESADIPLASTKPEGSLYAEWDTNKLKQVYQQVWMTISQDADFPKATVANFQANSATGTMSDPEKINDASTTTAAFAYGLDEYAEVDFGKLVIIKRWRQYGNTINDGNGTWKIQYWDVTGEAWVDWVTGIATRKLSSWSSYTTETVKLTTKIRLVATLIDGAGRNIINELEVIY